MISIICPCYNEEKYIRRALESILAQDYTGEVEILVFDGRSEDNTRSIVEEVIQTHSGIRLIDNPNRAVSYAINMGFEMAKGDIIMRIDAHSIYPSNYVSKLAEAINTLPNAASVGGVCRTLPANESGPARAIATACSHRFGVGSSDFRVGTNEVKKTDTVPFGCWKKEWINKVGGFDTELIRNEDDEYNARIHQKGGTIYLIPDVVVDYYARENMKKHWMMFYQYGLYKPVVNHKLRHPATLRQFVPPLFVLALIWVWPLYLVITILIALQKKNIYLIPAFATMHIAYGTGYLIGLIKVLKKQTFNVESSR